MPEVNEASPVRAALGKKKVTAASPRDERMTAIRQAYARLFQTRDGKVVLEDLRNQFYDNEISDSDTRRDVGKRDVLLYIKRRVTQ